MDRHELTSYQKELGAQILRDLDSSEFPVSAALWFWNVDSETWLYTIASPLVNVIGPKAAYTRVSNMLHDKKNVYELVLELNNISIVSDTSQLINLLKIAIRTESDAIGSIEFNKNTINNHFIEAAFIYRMA